MRNLLRHIRRLLTLFPLVFALAGCGQQWAVVSRTQPKGTVNVVSDPQWTREEAKAEANRLKMSGYALKGSVCLLTKETALSLAKREALTK